MATHEAAAQNYAPAFKWTAPTKPPAGTLIIQDKTRGMIWLVDLRRKISKVIELPFNFGNHESALSGDGRWLATGHYETLPKGAAALSGIPGDEVSLVDLSKQTSIVYPTVASPKPATRSHGVLWLNDGRLAVTAELANAVILYPPPNQAGTAQVIELGDTGCRTPHMLRQIGDAPLLLVTCRATNPGDGPQTPGYLVAIDLKSGKKRAFDSGVGAEGIAVTPGGDIWVGNYRENSVSVYGFNGRGAALDDLILKKKFAVPQPMRLAYEPTTNSIGIVSSSPQAPADAINFRTFDATTHQPKASKILASQSRGALISHGLSAIPGFYITGGVNNQAVVIVNARDLSVVGEILLPRCTRAPTDQNNNCMPTMRNPNDTTPAMPDGFAWSTIPMRRNH